MIDLGGFQITTGEQMQIIAIVVLYSLVVVALGFYVKTRGRGGGSSKLSHFLTGGSGLSGLEVGMVSMTFGLAGGTMVSGPGLSYGVGFISIVAIFAGIIGVFATFGNCGKKASIIGRRLGASTIVQLMHHRFQSKRLVCVMVLGMVAFVIPKISSQLMVSAKLFTAITGGESYLLGLLIATAVTVIYTLSGGLKSVTRICVFQGFLMVGVVLVIFFRQYSMVYERFGSVQAAYQYVAEIQPQLLSADNWTPMYTLGMALLYGWASFGQPGATHTALTYRSPKAFSRAIIISLVCSTFIQLMYLSRALSPEFWRDYLLDMHPIVPSMVLSLVLMVVVSRRTAKVPLTAVNFLISYTLQAMGKGVQSAVLTACRQGILNVPLLIFMNHMVGLYGMIWTQLVVEVIMLPVSFGMYRATFRHLPAGPSAGGSA